MLGQFHHVEFRFKMLSLFIHRSTYHEERLSSAYRNFRYRRHDRRITFFLVAGTDVITPKAPHKIEAKKRRDQIVHSIFRTPSSGGSEPL